MEIMERARAVFGDLSPLAWWLILLAIVGVAAGIVSGYFRARKIQTAAFKWRTFRRELFWAVLNISVTAFALGTITAFLTNIGWIKFDATPTQWWVIVAEYAVYVIGFDTWFYWWHRLMHVEPIYSWTHKIHHGSISPMIGTTSPSMHPLEGIIEGASLPLLTALFTFHTETMLFIVPTAAIMGQYVHCGHEFLPSWWNKSWLTKWFISATFHDQHHRYFKGNYGGYTTVWDRICGTVRPHFEADFEKITTRPVRVAPDKGVSGAEA